MLVKPIDLSRYWKISPRSVLHVGAHMGEEKALYNDASWGPITWVEAQPELVEYLNKVLSESSDQVICATIWDENDVNLKLKISSNSGSSSLLEFGTHKESYPQISFTREIDVTTSRLDRIIDQENMPNFLNLDIQGVELQALRSLGSLITKLDYIYVEINTKEVYRGCTKLADLDNHLSNNGFKRVITRRYLRHGWGEALYIRKNIYSKTTASFLSRTLNAIDFYFPQLKNFINHLIRGTYRG